ncbi:hypothetical protein BDA99DRAFT_563592 [Phascolomyces articulosus]|uniref:Spindle assembly checkpoint component MAD1 n=1 Tax=Phascolomyces articulosus TaxID=60185 RepID=A0AAD5PAF6_9FUNG|nr:hypothetical protein BDA99DRAFT_563592 [Phascolomyces articulosus]
MMITLEDTASENDDRPRITRESVFRDGYQPIDKAVESFLDEARMKAVQAQIDDLRRELHASNLERETLNQTFAIERKQLQHELENVIQDKMEAQKRAMHHHNNTIEAADTLKLIKSEHTIIVEKLRNNVERLQQQNDELSRELKETQVDHQNLRIGKEETEDQLTNQVTELKDELDILKTMREGYELRLNDAHQQILNLTNELSECQVKQSEITVGSESRLLAGITEQFKRQCELTKEREVSNHILKEELTYYRNNYPDFEKVLEEKLSLQRENAQAQQLKIAYRKLQEENERLRDEQKEWSQYIESTGAEDQLHTPRDIIYRLTQEKRAMQQTQLHAKELEERLEQAEGRAGELYNQVNEANSKLVEMEELLKKNEVEKESAVQEKQIIALHRDMLSAQMTSMSKVEEATATPHEETFPLTQRIEQLETLLKEYQEQLAQTKSTLIRERAQRTLASSSSFSSDGSGRILELKSSPANLEQQCRAEELNRLLTENRELLNTLRSYQEDSYDDTVGLGEKRKRELGAIEHSSTDQQVQITTIKVPSITLDNLQAQIDKVKSDVAQRDKRILRLTQVFKRRLDEVLDGVRLLLGYSLSFQPDQSVRISSASVDGREFAFIYSLDEDDQPRLRVIGTAKSDYMRILQGTYETFIGRQSNIPAFLSSVTLELMDSKRDDSRVYYNNAYEDELGDEEEEGELVEEDKQQEGMYYDQGQYSEEEGYYDEEEDDEMNDYGVDYHQRQDGPGNNHDEPITIDDDDDD